MNSEKFMLSQYIFWLLQSKFLVEKLYEIFLSHVRKKENNTIRRLSITLMKIKKFKEG